MLAPQRKKRTPEKQRARNERRLAKKRAAAAAQAAAQTAKSSESTSSRSTNNVEPSSSASDSKGGSLAESTTRKSNSFAKPSKPTGTQQSLVVSSPSTPTSSTSQNSSSKVTTAPKSSKKRSEEKQRARNARRLAKKQKEAASLAAKASPSGKAVELASEAIAVTSTSQNPCSDGSTLPKSGKKRSEEKQRARNARRLARREKEAAAMAAKATPSKEIKSAVTVKAPATSDVTSTRPAKTHSDATVPVAEPPVRTKRKRSAEKQRARNERRLAKKKAEASASRVESVVTPQRNVKSTSVTPSTDADRKLYFWASPVQMPDLHPDLQPSPEPDNTSASIEVRSALHDSPNSCEPPQHKRSRRESAAEPKDNDDSQKRLQSQIQKLTEKVAECTATGDFEKLPSLTAQLSQLSAELQSGSQSRSDQGSAPMNVTDGATTQRTETPAPAEDAAESQQQQQPVATKRKRSKARQQARNERRLAKKRAAAAAAAVNAGAVSTNAVNVREGTENASTPGPKRQTALACKDPSALYLPHPLQAPIVRQFRYFFSKVQRVHHFPTAKVYVGPHEGWRTIAKLTVRAPKSGTAPVIGIFAPGSHDVVELLTSGAHHPAINCAVQRVSKAAAKSGVRGYNGVDHGGLSYIGLSVESRTKRVQLVLVFNCLPEEQDADVLKQFIRLLTKKAKWHSIWSHYHKADRHNNAIFGREGSTWVRAYPPPPVLESDDPVIEVLDLPSRNMDPPPALRFPPNVFRQANLNGFTAIIREIRCWMNPNSVERDPAGRSGCNKCVELYGGVGTIGLNVLDLVEGTLSCSDENPFNKACFLKTRDNLASEHASKASYITAGAASMAQRGELQGNVDVLIVDPPRKGLDEEVLEQLERPRRTAGDRPRRIIYISCGFKAFQRDFERIRKHYKVIYAAGHVLFPGANHIETMCVFQLRDPADIDNGAPIATNSFGANSGGRGHAGRGRGRGSARGRGRGSAWGHGRGSARGRGRGWGRGRGRGRS